MTATVELIPLRCLQCETRIPANPDEVAWVCSQCGQGLRLDGDQNLIPLEVHYAAELEANKKGKPYWVVNGEVNIHRYEHPRSRKLKRVENWELHTSWNRERRFLIPAYTCELDRLVDLGRQYFKSQPRLHSGPAVQFEPVTLPLEEVYKVAEFIVVSIEAERRDRIEKIEVKVKWAQTELWILP